MESMLEAALKLILVTMKGAELDLIKKGCEIVDCIKF